MIVLPSWALLLAPIIGLFRDEDRIIVKCAEQRMYCVVSQQALDLMDGEQGKLAAQAGHGFVHAFWDAERRHFFRALRYKYGPAAVKITLVAKDHRDLEELATYYKDRTGVSVVRDAGRTILPPGTATCVGIGPLTIHEADGPLSNYKSLRKPKKKNPNFI